MRDSRIHSPPPSMAPSSSLAVKQTTITVLQLIRALARCCASERVDPDAHSTTQQTTDFAKGFGKLAAISRVADVAFAPDGRLFFCDDQGGAIYWIAPKTLKRR